MCPKPFPGQRLSCAAHQLLWLVREDRSAAQHDYVYTDSAVVVVRFQCYAPQRADTVTTRVAIPPCELYSNPLRPTSHDLSSLLRMIPVQHRHFPVVAPDSVCQKSSNSIWVCTLVPKWSTCTSSSGLRNREKPRKWSVSSRGVMSADIGPLYFRHSTAVLK